MSTLPKRKVLICLFRMNEGATADVSNRLMRYFGKVWLQCLILAGTGLLVHLPALQAQFVWDDDYLASGNPFIKSPLLIAETFRHHLFLDSSSPHYRPVQNISYILDYILWNSDPNGFHLTNILLHVACGVLLFSLLRQLFVRHVFSANLSTGEVAAFFVALLWIVHPVHSAAVDYISGRADSLAFAFGCGGWLLFLRARSRTSLPPRCFYYSAAAVSGLLSICSREIGAIWLCLFLLDLFVFEKQARHRTKILSLGCGLLLVVTYLGLRHLPEDRSSPGATYGWNGTIRSVFMLRAFGDYARLMVYPANLHMERTIVNPQNYRTTQSWEESAATEYLSILGLGAIAALAYGASRKGVGQGLRIFGLAWFVLGYLPVSNIIELNATVAEHWLYLPSVGFLIFLAGCAIDLPLPLRKSATALACLAALSLSVRAYIRSTDWVTPETFYSRTLAAGGTSARIAVNLGQIYSNRGDLDRAESIFRRVLQSSPGYPVALNNLADVLYRKGKHEESEAIFAESINASTETRKEYPRTWMAALNLAYLKRGEQKGEEALSLLEKARADYPRIWEIIRLEADILRESKGPAEALVLVRDFARENWWHQGAAMATARLELENGEVEDAARSLRFASWLDVHDAEALNLLASIRFRQNRLEEARAAQARAVGRRPDEPRQYRMLSDILVKMGREDDARLAMAKIANLAAVAKSTSLAN